MTERKRRSIYTASFRLSLTPAVKSELEDRAASAGISTADAARQYLDVALATAALGTKDQADADMAKNIVRSVSKTVAAATACVVRAENAAMSAPEDEKLKTELVEIESTRGYGALTYGYGYDPWGLTEEALSTARERAVRVCERLSGLDTGIADVLTLLRQESPAVGLSDTTPYDDDQTRSEIAFLVQVVLATADDSVLRSEQNRLGGARARLIEAAKAANAEEGGK